MPLFTTPDGRYTVAWQTPGEGDGNSVIYDRGMDLAVPWPGTPVWDRFSYEASLGEYTPRPSPPPQSPTPAPPPSLPDPFSFPGPRLIRVTNEQEGTIPPRFMSYWANAFLESPDTALVFCGNADGLPRFFRVHLSSKQVDRLGSLGVPYRGETEGWYWDIRGWLYVYEGSRFRRLHPLSGQDELIYDISTDSRIPAPSRLWQPHSSDDGLVHSATVELITSNGPYARVGTVVCWNGHVDYYPAEGILDESAVSADGRYLIIKEDEDNRIIRISSGETRHIADHQRSLGHSDSGPSYILGEADKPDPGMCGWWDLDGPLTEDHFHGLFNTLNMGYVAVRGDRVLHSSETQLRLVDRFTGYITNLIDHGGPSDYDGRVKANLSPCGRLACFMSPFGGPRRDVWLLTL